MNATDLRDEELFDKLTMACRRYAQIAPRASDAMTLGQPELLSNWLQRHVCEIVAALMTRPEFRRRVRWSIERLTGETNCDERQAVESVEDGLIRYAKALLAVADSDEMRYQLSRLGHNLGVKSPGSESDSDDEASQPILDLETVESIANCPWNDLVSWRDFFGPALQFNLKDAEAVQFGEFLPFVNKNLLVPGDFVARCLEIRVNRWKEELDKFWVRCDTARRNGNIAAGSDWEELNEIRSGFNKSLRDLQSQCFEGPQARVRDSCVVLLQIYVGFHQQADLSWLGPAANMVRNVAGLPYRVQHRQEWDVPERAAKALIDIADLVRRQQSPEDVIDEKKQQHRLVLVEEQRDGFFDGKPIDSRQDMKWHGSLHWELLWELAEQALLGRNVDAFCLSNLQLTKEKTPPSNQAVKDRRANLKRMIVPDLNDLILDAGTGTYRLALDPSEICLLVWSHDEELQVWEPQTPRSLLTPV